MEFISRNESDTLEVAKKIVKYLKSGDVVLLEGDLGAGKTTLVKCIVSALGGEKDSVTSPTFTIVNEYVVKGMPIYHMDLYRIKSADELFNIGIEDYLYGGGICFVEWPERAPELFENYKKITIEKLGENSRKFTFGE